MCLGFTTTVFFKSFSQSTRTLKHGGLSIHFTNHTVRYRTVQYIYYYYKYIMVFGFDCFLFLRCKHLFG